MSLGHRILVPLDGSDLAERALPLASSMARHADGVLHLVGVYLPWTGTDLPPVSSVVAGIYQDSRDQLEEYLDRVADALREGGLEVKTQLRVGRPEAEILSACRERGADVIAMATHGRGGLDRLWLGSVADRVLRRATVPVLLVSAAGDSNADEPRSETSLVTDPRNVRTIIVPLDGSKLAEKALVPATALGEAFDADYILIRVVSPAYVLGSTPYPGVTPINVLMEQERSAAHRHLEEVAGRMSGAGYRVKVVVAEEGEPVRAILHLLAATPDTLLTMATHGRGGLRRAFMGSTADKLVRATTRPMLLVRPPREYSRPGSHRQGLGAFATTH